MKTEKNLSDTNLEMKRKLKRSFLLLKKFRSVRKLNLQRFEQFFALFAKINKLAGLHINFVKYPLFIKELFTDLYLRRLRIGGLCLAFCYGARNFRFIYLFRKSILRFVNSSMFIFNSRALVSQVQRLIRFLMLKRLNRYLESFKSDKIMNLNSGKIIKQIPNKITPNLTNPTVGDLAKVLRSKSFSQVPSSKKKWFIQK